MCTDVSSTASAFALTISAFNSEIASISGVNASDKVAFVNTSLVGSSFSGSSFSGSSFSGSSFSGSSFSGSSFSGSSFFGSSSRTNFPSFTTYFLPSSSSIFFSFSLLIFICFCNFFNGNNPSMENPIFLFSTMYSYVPASSH
ncbi:MAG: hypothetical protein GX928_00830 [Ruminococcaceae bacterium]|nr:hypothetical protein [Oscillospiraceae bacterium]